MTISIGTDIIEIDRIASVHARQGEKLVNRILTPDERLRYHTISNEQSKVSYLAKRWCVKEAIAKALGTGIAKGIGWQEIEISNTDSGAPVATLSGKAHEKLIELGGKKALISLSDERHYAVAFCSLV